MRRVVGGDSRSRTRKQRLQTAEISALKGNTERSTSGREEGVPWITNRKALRNVYHRFEVQPGQKDLRRTP